MPEQLAALPTATTREPGVASPVAPLDPQAQARLAKGVDFGRYYALIIGNQNYQVLEHLQTPRLDAERAAQLLHDKYGFNRSDHRRCQRCGNAQGVETI